MKNSSRRISANDINKFCYCPYQWYYERYYGGKELRAMKTELNSRLGLEDTMTENFNKGNNHHKYVHIWYKLLRIALILFMFGCFAFGVYLRFNG